MPDRETVLKGLQIERECVSRNCNRDCEKCDLVQDRDYLLSVYDGAIAMLKEQEPIKPTVSVDTWICSKCGHTLESQELIDDKENPHVLICEQYQYCPDCGRKVKWE